MKKTILTVASAVSLLTSFGTSIANADVHTRITGSSISVPAYIYAAFADAALPMGQDGYRGVGGHWSSIWCKAQNDEYSCNTDINKNQMERADETNGVIFKALEKAKSLDSTRDIVITAESKGRGITAKDSENAIHCSEVNYSDDKGSHVRYLCIVKGESLDKN